MKQDEQPELWEAHFCGQSTRTLRIVGTFRQLAGEIEKSLWWRSDKWTLAEVTRIGPVRIAPSVDSQPKETHTLEQTCTIWTASWLPQNT